MSHRTGGICTEDHQSISELDAMNPPMCSVQSSVKNSVHLKTNVLVIFIDKRCYEQGL